MENLTDQTLLVKIAWEGKNKAVREVAIRKLSDQRGVATKVAAAPDDLRTQLIYMVIDAFDRVPPEHRARLMGEILPAICGLNHLEIASVLGKIVSIRTKWSGTKAAYARGTVSKPGEIFQCTIKLANLAGPVEHTWATDFPYVSDDVFLAAEVKAKDMLVAAFKRLPRSALTKFENIEDVVVVQARQEVAAGAAVED